LPIVVLVTDVTWHNAPGATYSGISPAPQLLADAVAALNGIGARFIGVAVNGGGRSLAEIVARDTGTVDMADMPIVYDAAAGNVSSSIVDGISRIAGGVRQNVSTRTQNVAGNPDEFDATTFIKSIVPVEGFPMTGYESKDDTTFYGVVPGTLVDFAVEFYNDVRPPAAAAQLFKATIVVVGNGVADLDERQVYIIVPPDGAVIVI
jgi:hypothetical protein